MFMMLHDSLNITNSVKNIMLGPVLSKDRIRNKINTEYYLVSPGESERCGNVSYFTGKY